ncbi:uncharacterized protein si:busm1-163l24.3 [Scophthalmus maximus]|uniref:uncharacterized protein si:busm1-163l24.3 n=1 Tax=Scophthalmus maximus TaxID=52904 RepID=UPI001FA8B949|nr:uncharacterized protein si:busm1-163l24.3 [Scophthalmus maximus]XP_035470069.2 uncharacterized protein si:busm1-163l24.3 [Scophthalmus maximus]XP_035470070.2 uncharacterized protein si:busm1-163l24.3 [Scophthalmus maximus]XP_035470071.2 uncharacterized protein si:busm1-163l24.3 [Scophthalmus maximus]
MAERGRAVRVSGLPTDVEDDRLKDKLLIYFLRARNGGGEVESVTVVRATPASALITFEESEAAQRVVRQSPHTLDLDGKTYELVATEHHESLDPDQVILSLTASVNCSQLPGGMLTVESLHGSHPDVQINYDAEEICTLLGEYSKVQAALAQLLGPHSADGHSPGRLDRTGSTSAQTDRKSLVVHSGKPNRPRAQSEAAPGAKPPDEHNPSSRGDPTPSGYGGADAGQAAGAGAQPPAAPDENFSLIVDADMFQYVRKHRSREYQYVLGLYDVEVVDVTSQGLTTLFLQVAAGVMECRRAEQGRLESARKALSRFYQENETKICRAQLAKGVLSPGGGLQRGAIEGLNARLPKLLLNEDDTNIYIVGSIGDVSEAKRFLLLDHDKVRATKDDVASLFSYPAYDPSSLAPADAASAVTASPAEGRLSDGRDQLLRSEDDERRAAEGARRWELEARFKDLGLAALGARPTDFTLRPGPSSPSRQARAGPMLGHDVLSETTGLPRDRVPRAESQITGGDILFKGGVVHSPASATQNKVSLNSNCLDAAPKNLTPSLSTAAPSSPGSPARPPAESGSTLRRASSFSGTPQQKAQATSRKSHDDSGRSTSRARSSSVSMQTGSDRRDVSNAEITVSIIMWQHIKDAYSSRVKDLTADDVQLKESRREGGDHLTVSLSGTNQSKVSSCHLGLQTLVESVGADFSVQVLLLSELGVTGPKDETLKACCADVCNRYKKISILILKKRLLLLGPEQLCSRVGATLREVFSTELAQTPQQQDFSPSSATGGSLSASLQVNEEHRSLPRGNSSSQATAGSQAGRAEEVDGGDPERAAHHERDSCEAEPVNGPVDPPPPPPRKNPVLKEKVKSRSTDGLETLFIPPAAGSATRGNGVGSSTVHTDGAAAAPKKERATQKDGAPQRRAEVQAPAGESRSGPRDLGYICVCGDDGASAVTTKCGASMCSKCLDTVHVHCRVCHVPDDRAPRGIRGEMSHFKLHKEEAALKVTYCIPEGIQGKDHPSPGSPFHGGVFDAFLPDCEKAVKLLPRLEKAFRRGLTFTVTGKEAGARVTWDRIPHKTSLQGGESGNGYPDPTYLTRLSQVLTSHGIEEEPDSKSQ